MDSFLTLTKVFFLSGISTNRKTNSQRPVFKQLGIMALVFTGISLFYNISMFFAVNQSAEGALGVYRDILLFVLTIASFFTVVMTFNQMQTALFNSKDFEFVESLPVRSSVVIAAKISSVLIFCIAEDIIIFMPSLVLYLVFTGDVFTSVLGFIAMFFVSLVPLLLSSLLGTLVALLTKRLKKKNVFQIIVYLMYFVVAFSVSFSMSGSSFVNRSGITKAMPHIILFKNAVEGRNILPFLGFIGVNLAAFAAVVAFIALLYRPVNSIKERTGGGAYKAKKSGDSKLGLILFKKDLKMLTGKANYFINSVFGSILYPIYSIMFMFMNNANSDGGKFLGVMVLTIPVMGIIMNSITNSTLSSISLEGKSFENLLSYPVSAKEIIRSKIRVGFFVPSIISIVGSSLILVMLGVKNVLGGLTWPTLAAIYLAPQFALMYASVTGMLCNLRWPKIHFENEIQVIKNSRSALFGMLFIFLPGMVAGGIVFVLNFISPLASLIALAAVYAAMILTVSLILRINGEKLFANVVLK